MTDRRQPLEAEPAPGIAERRKRRKVGKNQRSDARFQDILRAAAVVFREKGFAQTALRDVAEAVQIDRATIYYYVATKEELLIEILAGPLQDMTASVRELALSDKKSASDRLAQAIQSQFDSFAKFYPELFVFFAEALHLNKISSVDVAGNARTYGDLVTRIIEQGQASGEFRTDVPPRIAMLGIVGMGSWTHRWYKPDGPLSLEEIGNHFAVMAVRSVQR